MRSCALRKLYPLQPIVGVGAIIINDNRILLEKRLNTPGKGKWSIPGGLLELGETIDQAVIREVKEETGLDVAKPLLVDVVDHIELDEKGKIKYHFVILDYFVSLESGIPKADSDAEDLKWITFSEVLDYDLTSSFRLFFKTNREKVENLNSCP